MKAETLKKSILQYAMQGKLVEQDPNDEPASVLLARIKAEKEQLIKDGKIKKEKPLPPITEDEIPYELPQGWEWVHLGEIVSISTGQYDANHATENGKYAFFTCSYTPMKCQTYSYEGQGILLPGNGANVGLSIFYEGKFDAYQRTYVLQGYSNLFLKYIHYMLLGNWKEYNANKLYGGATPYIKLGNIENYPVALPPVSEQQRIVEKLEQILPLVGEYGKNEEKLSELNKTLPDKIKQSILQYAVQGKLVPQNPDDEPASELLKRIKAEKEQLIKDGKIKKEKPLPPITEDEIPYELPQGWEWVRIGTITDIGTGTTPQTSNSEYYNGNINWVSSSSTGNDFITKADKLISQKAVDECRLRIYNPDTLVIALYGQGKTRGQITQLKIPSCINQACAAICLINEKLLNLSYVKYFYIKQYNDIRSLSAGGAQPNLNVQKIKNTLIPIPPLAEQQRIVTKVEELMQIVDKLE